MTVTSFDDKGKGCCPVLNKLLIFSRLASGLDKNIGHHINF
jgi:hypothetical protein